MIKNIYWKIFWSHAVVLSISLLILYTAKLSLFSSTMIVLIMLVFSFGFSSYFISNIDKISRAIFDISNGKPKELITMNTGSEFRKIGDAINELQYRLFSTVGELSTSQDQKNAILSSMIEGVLAVDGQGRVMFANPSIEKMFNVLEPEILNRPVREVIRNNEIADLIEEVSRSNRIIQKEIEVVTPIEGIFMAHANPITRDNKTSEGVLCVLYDISDIRKLERYRSEFVANVSHELKTPLTVIKSNVETLLNGAIDDKEHNVGFLKKIDKHANNLYALIDDLLEISKLEAKKDLGAFKKVDICKVGQRALETVSDKIHSKNISLVKNKSDEQLEVQGLEDHIYRAILNLLDNSANYTDEDGRISISCKREDNEVWVTVSDTGVGIPEKDLPRIFERFYRVEKSRARDVGGTGLGLAIVKHVMNVHNGRVIVDSIEGKGSSFTLVFPV
jgi:two-component system, OmpR family, phosphate regulon sensor histidine kinase PhoR